MENKTLLGGIIGFILGGLLVSIVAVVNMQPAQSSMSLDGKTGDEFDKAFVVTMIAHHQGAIDMAKLAEKNAKHTEIKELSRVIITTQQEEVDQLKLWQSEWGYETVETSQDSHMSH